MVLFSRIFPVPANDQGALNPSGGAVFISLQASVMLTKSARREGECFVQAHTTSGRPRRLCYVVDSLNERFPVGFDFCRKRLSQEMKVVIGDSPFQSVGSNK
jgi:hypothetical protein